MITKDLVFKEEINQNIEQKLKMAKAILDALPSSKHPQELNETLALVSSMLEQTLQNTKQIKKRTHALSKKVHRMRTFLDRHKN